MRREKTSFPDRLDRLVSRRHDKLPDVVFFGANGDPYPADEKLSRITHRCLEVMAKHLCPIVISTESSLILRDIDLIRELHEDSQATVMLKLSADIFRSRRGRGNKRLHSKTLAVLERLCRSGVQAGIELKSSPDRPVTKHNLIPFFQVATNLNADFIYIPELFQRQFSSRVKKSILKLSLESNIRLTPRRFLPKDIRLENFWLAETLANHAFQLELSGSSSAHHWAAAKRIDNFDGDVRLKALQGDLISMTSNNSIVQNDVERFMRGERNFHLTGASL